MGGVEAEVAEAVAVRVRVGAEARTVAWGTQHLRPLRHTSRVHTRIDCTGPSLHYL